MSGATPERLRRSGRDRIFAGVCGGIAEYLRVDATLVRALFVLAAFVGGLGLLLYLVLWLLMPADGAPGAAELVPGRGREVVAYALIAIGVVWLFSNLGLLHLEWRWALPLLLIALGAALLARRVF